METKTAILYATACFAGALIPGPTSLLALTNGASRNWKVVVAGMFGAALSDLLIVSAVGFGLGALLATSATLFSTVKWIGVVVLAWLAVQMWRSSPTAFASVEENPNMPMSRVFFRSFGVTLSNPKLLLFFSAFLPQFIDPSQPVTVQYMILGLVSAGVDVVVMALYALGGAQVARVMTERGITRLNRSYAAVMFTLSAGLAMYRRNN
nr:LysE family translocator [uncultured Cupriavidus sp.]